MQSSSPTSTPSDTTDLLSSPTSTLRSHDLSAKPIPIFPFRLTARAVRHTVESKQTAISNGGAQNLSPFPGRLTSDCAAHLPTIPAIARLPLSPGLTRDAPVGMWYETFVMTSIAVGEKVVILHVPMPPPPVRRLRPTLSLSIKMGCHQTLLFPSPCPLTLIKRGASCSGWLCKWWWFSQQPPHTNAWCLDCQFLSALHCHVQVASFSYFPPAT